MSNINNDKMSNSSKIELMRRKTMSNINNNKSSLTLKLPPNLRAFNDDDNETRFATFANDCMSTHCFELQNQTYYTDYFLEELGKTISDKHQYKFVAKVVDAIGEVLSLRGFE